MIAGGSTWTEMLSNVPRARSEPTPTKPLFSPTATPSSIRGANVCVKAALPSSSTVTVVPLTATSIEYQVLYFTPPDTDACTSTIQPAAVRRPMTSLLVDWSTPANLKSVGVK